MRLQQKILYSLAAFAAIILLIQIWVPAYFTTGDGPCVLYNAHILKELWANKDTTFYNTFFYINYDPNPNWLALYLLAHLQSIYSAVIAEKIFLSLYTLLLGSGMFLLLKKLDGKDKSYWPIAIVGFIISHTLAKGFYSFTLSMALFPWLLLVWYRFTDKRNIANSLLLFVVTGIMFFTHLLPFLYGFIVCICILTAAALSGKHTNSKTAWAYWTKNYFAFLVTTAPFLLLTSLFTSKQGGIHPQLSFYARRILDFVKFSYGICYSSQEAIFVTASGVLITLLLLISVYQRIRAGKKVTEYDGYLLAALVIGLAYVYFPEEFMGRIIIIAMRTQPFLYFMALCLLALLLPKRIKNAAGWVILFLFLGMSWQRFTVIKTMSNGVEEIVSACKNIKPYSTVLPLYFNKSGLTPKGDTIADKNWVFCHTAQYAGCSKPLIFLDNYEANTGYYPLFWQANINPYHLLGINQGFEDIPPAANIDAYTASTGKTVDYIVTWCMPDSIPNNNGYAVLHSQIVKNYNLIFTSASHRVQLYQLNKH